MIVEFVLKVYFASWFDIKKNNKLTHGSINLYNIIIRINNFPDLKIRQICYNVLNNNSIFFAHGENILVAMLGDIDETVRRKAVKIILKLRENGEQVSGEAIEKKVVDHAGTSDEMAETLFNINQYPPIDKLDYSRSLS